LAGTGIPPDYATGAAAEQPMELTFFEALHCLTMIVSEVRAQYGMGIGNFPATRPNAAHRAITARIDDEVRVKPRSTDEENSR
jgi:hypothetical protein